MPDEIKLTLEGETAQMPTLTLEGAETPALNLEGTQPKEEDPVALDESSLSPEERKVVDDFAQKIDLSNSSLVVRQTATHLLMISGSFLPLSAFTQGSYFTIRSGGKTFITFLFDCVYTWVVCLPIAFLLSSFTSLPLEWVFLCVQAADILKAVIGAVMLKSGIWANNMVSGDSPAQTQEV